MSYTTAACTDPGRVRQRNEDASLLLQWQVTGPGATFPVVLAAVADGMGGHANGHVASGLTARTLAATVVSGLSTLPWERPPEREELSAVLGEAVGACAARVNEAIIAGHGPMGSTLAVALICGRRLMVANVGDSRIYLMHQQLQQITVDHSLVARMVAEGTISPEEARVHPRRNEIYRTIGFARTAEPDYFALDLEAGDTLLLCSDGLHGVVAADDLGAILALRRPLAERCRRLVEMANAAGGEDNITAVGVHLEGVPAEAATPAADPAEERSP